MVACCLLGVDKNSNEPIAHRPWSITFPPWLPPMTSRPTAEADLHRCIAHSPHDPDAMVQDARCTDARASRARKKHLVLPMVGGPRASVSCCRRITAILDTSRPSNLQKHNWGPEAMASCEYTFATGCFPPGPQPQQVCVTGRTRTASLLPSCTAGLWEGVGGRWQPMKPCGLLIDIISHRCSHHTQHTIPPISSRNHVRACLRTCRGRDRQTQTQRTETETETERSRICPRLATARRKRRNILQVMGRVVGTSSLTGTDSPPKPMGDTRGMPRRLCPAQRVEQAGRMVLYPRLGTLFASCLAKDPGSTAEPVEVGLFGVPLGPSSRLK